MTCSLFDPPGFVVPFVLKPKLLVRELWRRNIDWDQDIGADSRRIWRCWREAANFLSEVEVDRCFNLHDSSVTDIQMHVFADASELAYGSVSYLKFSHKDGTCSCTFVKAKSKLAPIKSLYHV